jgi:hypothetical protein
MSSDPIPDDENPDDEGAIGVRTDFDPEEPIGEAVSEVIRKPVRIWLTSSAGSDSP